MPAFLFVCHSLGNVCYWRLVGNGQDTAKHPTVPRTAPTTGGGPASNANHAELRIQELTDTQASREPGGFGPTWALNRLGGTPSSVGLSSSLSNKGMDFIGLKSPFTSVRLYHKKL